jgi:hypothetical protein
MKNIWIDFIMAGCVIASIIKLMNAMMKKNSRLRSSKIEKSLHLAL